MTTTEERVARLRARVPSALVPALARTRAALAWRHPEVREDARAQMRFLLEHTRPDADLEEVARDYVRVQALRGELRWHPEMLSTLRVEGLDHLVAARDRGQGVLLSFVHHGRFEGGFASVARLGVRLHMVAYPYMLEPDAPLWLRQHVKIACLYGGTPVSAAVGTDGLVAHLRDGAVLAIATDVPGRTPMRFAGREVLGSFGAARLATMTGAPVVVLTTEFDDRGVHVRLSEPIESAGLEPRELLEQMLAIHESVQLRWPEQTDIPLSRWAQVPVEAARG
jgi:lauroyl/myristoyl acyltransferase